MSTEETKITEAINELHSSWFCRDEMRVRLALLKVAIVLIKWKPEKEERK